MIVSLEAIFLSVFVLLSQNRQAAKDRVRDRRRVRGEPQGRAGDRAPAREGRPPDGGDGAAARGHRAVDWPAFAGLGPPGGAGRTRRPRGGVSARQAAHETEDAALVEGHEPLERAHMRNELAMRVRREGRQCGRFRSLAGKLVEKSGQTLQSRNGLTSPSCLSIPAGHAKRGGSLVPEQVRLRVGARRSTAGPRSRCDAGTGAGSRRPSPPRQARTGPRGGTPRTVARCSDGRSAPRRRSGRGPGPRRFA